MTSNKLSCKHTSHEMIDFHSVAIDSCCVLPFFSLCVSYWQCSMKSAARFPDKTDAWAIPYDPAVIVEMHDAYRRWFLVGQAERRLTSYIPSIWPTTSLHYENVSFALECLTQLSHWSTLPASPTQMFDFLWSGMLVGTGCVGDRGWETENIYAQ